MSKDIHNESFDVAECFVGRKVDEDWIRAIVERVGPWVKTKGQKWLWDIVSFTSQRLGVIKPKLAREKFAQLLVTLCRQALDDTDTVSTITHNMENCRIYKPKDLDAELPQYLHRYDEEIQLLLNESTHEPYLHVESKPTVEGIMEKFLNQIVSPSTIHPQVLCQHPCYGDYIHPAFAIERYVSEKFQNMHQPSSVDAYECIDEKLTLSKLHEFHGKYAGRNHTKLYIVSPYGFDHSVQRVASENEIGLVRVSLSHPEQQPNYVLCRSVNDFEAQWQWTQMFCGEIDMDIPILIKNGNNLTTSMAEELNLRGIEVKPEYLLKAPILSNDDIELAAEQFLCYEDMPVNIYNIAADLGLTWSHEKLPDKQLARIDFSTNHITLALYDNPYYPRHRFSMGHEIGHHLFHRPLFAERGLITFGESDSTLHPDSSFSKNEQWWLEHHANRFSAALLMPKQRILKSYDRTYKSQIISLYGGCIRRLYMADNNPHANANAKLVILPMAHEFGVSFEAMKIRLKELDLLEEHNTKFSLF